MKSGRKSVPKQAARRTRTPLVPVSFRISAVVGALSMALASALGAQQLTDGAIAGRVLALEKNDPISQAAVRLADTEFVTLADDKGNFRLNRVPPGTYLLTIERLGYATRSDSVTVGPGTVVDITAHLSIQPIELAPLVAVIRSLVLERAGYYLRETQGFGGHFMDNAKIRDENPSRVTDLLRGLPGLRIVWGGIYGPRVFVNQRISFDDEIGCEPTVWVDGIRSTMRTYDVMRVEEIEGMEVYSGGGPGKFNDVCGSILIWTRVPIRNKR